MKQSFYTSILGTLYVRFLTYGVFSFSLILFILVFSHFMKTSYKNFERSDLKIYNLYLITQLVKQIHW